jgi:hypothetical protein
MASLADAMFDQQTRDYVSEELGGRIEVTTDYDAVNVTLAGQASDFSRLLELARAADDELAAHARIGRARARRTSQGAARRAARGSRARQTARRRATLRHAPLRPHRLGHARVNRAHRARRPLVMRERFLTPDNTTLVIVGGFDAKEVMRTMRQSFGVWRKSDVPVPPTFALPDPPDARTLVVNRPDSSRSNCDSRCAGSRAQTATRPPRACSPKSCARAGSPPCPSLRSARLRQTRRLPRGRHVPSGRDAPHARGSRQSFGVGARDSESALDDGPVRVRTRKREAGVHASSQVRARRATKVSPTSGSTSTRTRTRPRPRPRWRTQAAALTPTEAQRVAARLFLHTPVAVVAEGDAAQLRTELARAGAVEVFGEAAEKPTATEPQKPRQPGLQLKRPY